jgi:hypothetical protein
VRRAWLLAAVALAGCGEGTGSAPSATLREGTAQVQVTGDLRDAFLARLDADAPNVYTPPTGGFALSWADEAGDGVGIGGPLFMGTRETSQDLSLALSVVSRGSLLVFADFEGRCRITVEVLEPDDFQGGFTCEELAATDGTTIDADGTFQAGG